MATLDQYRSKRDFKKTSEPAGDVKRGKSKAAGGIFVIHKHAARQLHYDLRLEHGGVLWSWAVTRGPSLDPSEKRLAVHVEDHPLAYAPFEGTIPKGEYGGGSVIVWDEGVWEPEGDPEFGMKKGHIQFELKGAKLNGAWHLVRLKPRRGEKRDNWLLIKADDMFARPGEDILAEAPESVKSGMTIEEIGENKAGAVWHSKPREGGKAAKPVTVKAARQAETKKAPSREKPGKAAKLPAFIPPCLATLKPSPPNSQEWLHEIKFDGYRTQAHVSGGTTTLFTRTGLDWTHRFGEGIPAAFAALDCGAAVIDGEIVVLSDKGISSFSALQLDLSENRTDRFVFYAFDLLHLEGSDLTGKPLGDRKELLRALMEPEDRDGVLRYSEHFLEPGKTILKHACRMGLEGVVSKRADAPYRSGRGYDWVKTKCTLRQEFIIVGYLPSQATGRGLRSLVLGYHEDGKLKPAGRVGTGFTVPIANDLKRRLDRLKAKSSAFSGAAAKEKGVVWVKPVLVAEIEFGAWTADGNIRHASFQGLREDKPADEVVVETSEPGKNDKPAKAKAAAKAGAPKTGGAKSGATTSVTLSNAGKLLWPEAKVTKQGLVDHYAQVWSRMEPFVVNRPLSLVRAPDGIAGKQRFFQKHASAGMHEAISKMADPHDGEDLLYIRDFDGLAALVQLGVVEIHIWGCTIDALEKPDQIVFDLDPDEGLDVDDVRAAALDVKRRLEQLDMPSVVKTSGGKGFHVIAPLKPKAGWVAVKGFAHDFAKAMEQSTPDRYTATLSKKARKGRIFVDYLRNGRGSTTIAPYSSRAKPLATVSVPITWEQLEDGVGPADFVIGGKTTAKALSDPDAWANFDALRKPLRR